MWLPQGTDLITLRVGIVASTASSVFNIPECVEEDSPGGEPGGYLLDGAPGAEDDGYWLDGRRLFLGSQRSSGAALGAPALEEHVAGMLAEESSVLKEKRAGREERRLAKEAASAAAVAVAPAAEAAAPKAVARGCRRRSKNS